MIGPNLNSSQLNNKNEILNNLFLLNLVWFIFWPDTLENKNEKKLISWYLPIGKF